MTRCASLLLFAVLASASAATAQVPDLDDLPPLLDSLMAEAGVPGLGFAVFDRNGTLLEYVSGVKNLETGEPLDSNTVFEAASISKPVFAYIVLTLVDEGVLDLDAPLVSMVDRVPEVAYDPRVEDLTPRLLLTHQGGLPNWRARLNVEAQSRSELFGAADTLRFVTDPGDGYRYSGEGYVLLQQVVEQLTGQDLTELALDRVFGPLGMTNSSFVFDAKSSLNYSHGHNRRGASGKWQLRVPLASSTLLTTASDLAKFGSHLADAFEADSRFSELMDPSVTLESSGDRVHAWGLGLGLITEGTHHYFYHGGNNVTFIADFIYGSEEAFGYVVLTNSSNGPAVIRGIEQRLYQRDLGR